VNHHRAIYVQYVCSPCLYMFTAFEGMWCNHEGWCMQAITSTMVLEAVETMLAEAAERRRLGTTITCTSSQSGD